MFRVNPISGGMAQDIPQQRTRGALSNRPGRYELDSVAEDDGWAADDEPAPPLRTMVTADATRSVITRNDSPDVGFDRSINPYRGCEHGCVYCFARPTHAWLGLSPGLDFESRLLCKPEAASLLERELRRPNYRCLPIAMGTNTDPYQPVERRLRITRAILEVLSAFGHPLTITTKSALVLRDLDLLAPMAERDLVRVAVSITTLDRGLARRMEPRAATPQRRLDTIRALAEAGIPTAVMVAPLIPVITDGEMEAILTAAREAGARHAGYILIRLPLEVSDLFDEWLRVHFPGKAGHVSSLIRQMREGRLYDPSWRKRQTGTGAHADLLAQRFRVAARRLGLDRDPPPLNVDRFRPPPRAGEQLRLL
ncbi:MAG: PA0069 family radical SAM protein [Rhodospirillales bacterium]|nr:PA0069 family radical SAM protein [Rhodospirillales bacterium]